MNIVDMTTQYVAYKQSIGQSFITDAAILKAFCRHAGNIPLASISTEQVQHFLSGKHPVSSFWQRKHTTLSGLFRFAMTRGHLTISPLSIQEPQIPPPLTPYIYSRSELKAILDAIPKSCSVFVKIDPIVIKTLILVLYGACLRIGEALSLTVDDVDMRQNTLLIQKTKFYKSRLVPFGKDLKKVLVNYIDQKDTDSCCEPSEALFCFQDGRPLSQSAARNAFHRIRDIAGIKREDGGRYQPRLHDLRHAGAVHRVMAWYRAGADLQYLLPKLATYLGHINLAASQRYLTLTPELLQLASQRFEGFVKESTHD